jgi:hypothetical protein
MSEKTMEVMPLIMQHCDCSFEDAESRYNSFKTNPNFIKTGVIVNRQDMDTGHVIPLVHENKAHLLTPFIDNSRVNGGQGYKRKAVWELDIPELPVPDEASVISKLNEMVKNLECLQYTLDVIKNLDLDDPVKDLLRQQTICLAVGKDSINSLPPPVIISHMVKEHLGYTPARISDNADIGELYKLIGRAVRAKYIERTGVVPKKRKYSDNQSVKETNDYKQTDKVWISEIIRDMCVEHKVYPRASASMARGEVPFQH